MIPDWVRGLLPPLLAALSAGVVVLVFDAIDRIRHKRKGPTNEPQPYADRLADLTASLRRASEEVDQVLAELAQVAKDRADAVKKLDSDLESMGGQEKELKARIQILESTPLAVAEHFAKLVEPGERRSTRRDYVLFCAGVLVSTLMGIMIQLFLK